jgi:signal transduction histidine kinase
MSDVQPSRMPSVLLSPCATASPGALPAALQSALPLLDHLLEYVAVVDEDRRIVHANTAFLHAIGAPRLTDVAGRRFGDAVKCVHAAGAPDGCGSTDACKVCGGFRSQVAAFDGQIPLEECRIIRTDGLALDFRIRASPWDADGRRFLLLSALDTSGEQRRRLLERIFFHDLRNTAGGVVGFAELLVNEVPTDADPAQNALAGAIARLARQLFDEIESQACHSAAETGELQARDGPCDPALFLETLRDLYSHHAVAEGRRIKIESSQPAPTLRTDGVLLSRVVGNLLKNALEATRPGETVSLGAGRHPGFVEFRVHNPGVISPVTRLQIFQRSFSTKGFGRGLGTYSAQLIGERVLGGQVGFSSSPESGTTFWIRLPCPEAPAAKADSAAAG